MVYNFRHRNTNRAYPRVLSAIDLHGKESSPRGKPTKELFGAVTEITHPLERVQTTYGRGGNVFFLIAEALWILEGRGDVDWISYYSKSIGQFKDEGYPDYNGPYGVRMRKWGQRRDRETIYNWPDTHKHTTFDQLIDVYDKLREDSETRQALMTYHIPPLDAACLKTADRPCNVVSMLKIRDGKLHLHQVVRSNDVTWGLFPTNVWQWGTVLEVLAGMLGVGVGELWFFSDSLHTYLEDYNAGTNRVVLKEKRFYDVYSNYKPEPFKGTKEEFEDGLYWVMRCHHHFRKGNLSFEMPKVNEWFVPQIEMLRVFSVYKQEGIVEAMEMLNGVGRKDYMVAGSEYLMRNQSVTKGDVDFMRNNFGFTDEDIDYVTHGSKVE